MADNTDRTRASQTAPRDTRITPADSEADLVDVLNELRELKAILWRGTVEYRVHSGRVASVTLKSFREIAKK